MDIRLPRNHVLRCGYLMLQRYLRHNVGIHSAALAFYMLFMAFPLMIFVSSLLGILNLDVGAILSGLRQILPERVVGFVGMYLNYVQENPQPKMVLFGLFFSIFFPMRATNTLMRAVRTAYHLGPPRRPLIHLLKTLFYTVLLLVTFTLTLTLLSVTQSALHYATVHFGLPPVVATIWARIRFPVVTAMAFFAILGLYALSQDGRQPWRNVGPGALVGLLAWLLLSLLYSLYVERIANYSLLYGSIGTVVALLIWMYVSSTTLIMGAELNGLLISLRREEENVSKS